MPLALIRLVASQARTMALGIVLALWGWKSLSTMLYGVGPSDPMVLAAVGFFLLVVALMAAMAPALRASRIDPIVAMRGE